MHCTVITTLYLCHMDAEEGLKGLPTFPALPPLISSTGGELTQEVTQRRMHATGLPGRSSFSQRPCLVLGSKPILILADAVVAPCLPSASLFTVLGGVCLSDAPLGFPGCITIVGPPEFYAQGISITMRTRHKGTVAAHSVAPLPTHVPHCPTKLRLQNISSKVKL